MGQFIVIRKGRGQDRLESLDISLNAHGLVGDFRKDHGEWTILRHRKLNGDSTQPVVIDDQNFILHTGSFFYRQKTGQAALREFHADFDPTTMNWEHCRGHFGLVICKHGRLFVTNDGLGSCQLYHDPNLEIFTSSFISVLETAPRTALDRQGLYEYAWNGTTFGTKTFLANVRRLPHASMVELGPQPRIVQLTDPTEVGSPPGSDELATLAQGEIEKLRPLFSTYASDLKGPIRTALSGGYDSRLLLAMLLDAGVVPELFVYGAEGSTDVRIAKAVAEGEGLALSHIVKTATRTPEPDAFRSHCERNLYAFDGWKSYGLFDNSADIKDRQNRNDSGSIVLNGSVGEIYRNFFYLPDRSFTVREVIWSFFSRYAPSAMTSAFSIEDYEAGLGTEIQSILNTSNGLLSREQVEAIYPLFRGRFWTARDTAINQRFGRMLFPYMEPSVITGTAAIPIRHKNFGLLEAKMIALVNERLAGYPSAYGMSFAKPPPLGYRIKTLGSILRPPGLRKFSYRLQHRGTPNLPNYLSPAYLSKIIDTAMPYMQRYFIPDRIADPDVYNRVATVEYLCQRYNCDQPPEYS